MRPVTIKTAVFENGKKVGEADVEASFHQWGADYEEFEAGPGNVTVAVVEHADGTVELIHPTRVRFLDSADANAEGMDGFFKNPANG